MWRRDRGGFESSDKREIESWEAMSSWSSWSSFMTLRPVVEIGGGKPTTVTGGSVIDATLWSSDRLSELEPRQGSLLLPLIHHYGLFFGKWDSPLTWDWWVWISKSCCLRECWITVDLRFFWAWIKKIPRLFCELFWNKGERAHIEGDFRVARVRLAGENWSRVRRWAEKCSLLNLSVPAKILEVRRDIRELKLCPPGL